MEMFGFVCLILLLVAFTCGWVFIFIFDGTFGGKRDIPIYIMIAVLMIVIFGWLWLIDMLPFTVTLAI